MILSISFIEQYMRDLGRVVATIECRMTSTRLPGKVMLKACGKSMLELMAERVRQIEGIDEVIFATTSNPTDDCIEELAGKIGVKVYRGSEHDVLKRVLDAARAFKGDTIVELTGDCPLTDAAIVSQGLRTYAFNECDYLSNVHMPGYPIGLDVQVFSTELLSQADKEGALPEDREHVSWFFRRNPARFKTIHLAPPDELLLPDLRLTLDEKDDYELIRTIFEALYPKNPRFGYADILHLLSTNPNLKGINTHVLQKTI